MPPATPSMAKMRRPTVPCPALGTLENAWAVPNVGKHTPCPALSALQACPSVFTHHGGVTGLGGRILKEVSEVE